MSQTAPFQNYGYNPGFMSNPYAERGQQPMMSQPMQVPPAQNMYYPQPQAPQRPGVAAALVTGKEEALAQQVSFDGTLGVYVDRGHGVIYTKQFNAATGGSDFREYRLADQPDQAAEPSTVAYASMDAVNQLAESFTHQVEALNDRIKAMEKKQKQRTRMEADDE